MNNFTSLYNKYRPNSIEDVVGHIEIVKSLEEKINNKSLPNVILISGPTGVGKTTIARIIAKSLNINDIDLIEVNERGIDTIRHIEKDVQSLPFFGSNKMYIFDESHRLTSEAQEALLKLSEDVPTYQYFIFCTTDPQGMKKALRDRCYSIKFDKLTDYNIKQIVEKVIESENLINIDTEVVDKIVKRSDGSARLSINLIESIYSLDKTDSIKVLDSVFIDEDSDTVIDLCRSLMYKNYDDFIKCYKKVNNNDPEQTRRVVLGYLHSCLLGSKNKNDIIKILNIMEPLRFSVVESGKAGLLYALVKGRLNEN